MQVPGQPSIESVLQQSETRWVFFTRRELASAWRDAFEDAARSVPQPFWLFADDEKTPVALGFPVRTTPAWESLLQSLGMLIRDEVEAIVGVARTASTSAGPDRSTVVQRLAAVLENALVNSHGRRYTEILWLALSREISVRLNEALQSLAPTPADLASGRFHEFRYAAARRVADLAYRAEVEALSRLRGWGSVDHSAPQLRFGQLMREDLMPFAERRLTADLIQLDAWIRGARGVDPERFRRNLHGLIERLERLRQRDPGFTEALRLIDPEAEKLSPEARAFSPSVLDLIRTWSSPDSPKPASDVDDLLRTAGRVLRRFEVIVALRDRIFPVTVEGTRAAIRLRRQAVDLSAFTRALDFMAPGVVDSAVRRYGLLYDLVEFTALLEALRRQGRAAEERGLRFMAEFHRATEEIRDRYRLKFEKFLGDGAFYTARSARPLLLASAELRVVYESLKQKGFPFDRGLKIAVNVGTYHLLPLVTEGAERPNFEFFGHSLVELARLTTGKTTHEAEDIADYLIASGYDVHRVLEFLEPVRSAPRRSQRLLERPYAAYLEHGELVNLGCVTTEAFLRDLDAELAGTSLSVGSALGHRWVLVPFDHDAPERRQVGLRFLGTARLKGLEPTQVAEVVVFDAPPDGAVPVVSESSLGDLIHEIAGGGDEPEREEELAATQVPPDLCVASILENPQVRAWYLGLWDEERDALVHGFQIPLHTVELKDGEAFEVWLFRRRAELTTLYQGLRRQGTGSTFALKALRERDGFFTCLLAIPHRSPS